MNDSSSRANDHIVILFYKYTPQPPILHTHSSFILPNLLAYQKSLCRSNNITKGRILLSAEGINGTLYGKTDDIEKYIQSMDQFDLYQSHPSIIPPTYINDTIGNNQDNDGGSDGRIYSSIDWKKSSVPPNYTTNPTTTEPFPDLHIYLVDEIVSTGRTISVHDIHSYGGGGTHLSPKEFHEKLITTPPSNLVLLDIRNSFEHAVGHFVDNEGNKARCWNNVTSFAAFDKALLGDVNDCRRSEAASSSSCSTTEKNALKDKTIMMYCTGGIRCEKASVMLKKRGVENVFQLTGGIHRYLEEFNNNNNDATTTNVDNNNGNNCNNNNENAPSHGLYHGKNFVFDQRVALEGDGSIVGRCLYCTTPFDEISGSRLCTVCRDLVLVCPSCRVGTHRREYHCQRHASWRDCYYTFLEVFTVEELEAQMERLEELRCGEESKNVRKTLLKQIDKIRCRIKDVKEKNIIIDPDAVYSRRCRTCFRPDEECDGLCWGFWKTSRQQQQQ